MNALLAASSAFFLLHMLPATPLRPRLIGVAGEFVYAAIFSIASAAAIWWMVSSFNAAPYGDKLWVAPAAWLWLKAALVLFAYILIVGGVATPNPSAPGGDKVLEKGNAASGIYAITRHPLMWGIAIWAIAHMISQPNLRGFVFFGGFAATALIGSYLQQRRKRAQLAGMAGVRGQDLVRAFRRNPRWPGVAEPEGNRVVADRHRGRSVGGNPVLPHALVRRAAPAVLTASRRCDWLEVPPHSVSLPEGRGTPTIVRRPADEGRSLLPLPGASARGTRVAAYSLSPWGEGWGEGVLSSALRASANAGSGGRR